MADGYNDNTSTTSRTGTGKMPTISMDSDASLESMGAVNRVSQRANKAQTVNLSNVNSESSTTTHTTQRVSMPGAKPRRVSTTSERRKADISELAKPRDPKDIPGVDIKRSPSDEILKEGGPFDQYVERKTEEMKERMAYEEEKRQVEAMEEADKNPEARRQYEEAELEAASHLQHVDTYRVNAVAPDEDEEELEETVETEEDEEYDIEEDNTAKTSEEKVVPFYRSVGYQDDYEYPEEYNLPEDEEDEEDVEGDEDMEENRDTEVDFSEEVDSTPIEEPVEEVVEETSEGLTDESVYVLDEEESKENEIRSKRIKFVTDEESIEDLENEVNTSELPTEDERLEELKAEIATKITPRAKAINIKGFTIASKSTASNKIFETKEASAGKWVLPTTGICVQMREISGQKIEYLRENMGNNATQAKNALKVIYDHIVTPKPQSFEAWAKSIAYADYDHLFMPIYMAAFSDSNYIPQTCTMEEGKVPKVGTGCGKMFLTDNIDIMKMVKFKDDECKKKFWDLYDSDRTNSEGLYASEIVPVSDKFAIQFCEPTLYSVLFETGSYGREFTSKYESVIAFMPYIDKIYWIDAKRQTLVPVSYKEYTNNASKTAKSKVIRYSNVLDSLKTDEYTNVVSIISAINDNNDWMTYQIPEVTCPECGRVIPAEETSAANLLFTRHRLGILANSSIK